jgi:hypothetical protein
MLTTIVRQGVQSWKAALSSVAVVYVIVDTRTGNPYVGSACGVGGFWQRWVAYVLTGHGGNCKLQDLLASKGPDYAKNFQFAVLEVCNVEESETEVRQRESHWKNVLRSGEFGYN